MTVAQSVVPSVRCSSKSRSWILSGRSIPLPGADDFAERVAELVGLGAFAAFAGAAGLAGLVPLARALTHL